MTMLALKLCPFCGGEAGFATRRYDPNTVQKNGWEQDLFHGVSCAACGASNFGLIGYRTPDLAVARWNDRVAPAMGANVCVSRVPTDAMRQAGESAASVGIGKPVDDRAIVRVWDEMVGASRRAQATGLRYPRKKFGQSIKEIVRAQNVDAELVPDPSTVNCLFDVRQLRVDIDPEAFGHRGGFALPPGPEFDAAVADFNLRRQRAVEGADRVADRISRLFELSKQDITVVHTQDLKTALALAHYFIDASDSELEEDGLTRDDVLFAARVMRSRSGYSGEPEVDCGHAVKAALALIVAEIERLDRATLAGRS